MDNLQCSWDILIDSKHSSWFLHGILIKQVLEGDRRPKLQHFELWIACLSDVTIHIDLIIVMLLQFDRKWLESSVFVTLQFLHQRLILCEVLLLIQFKLVGAAEHYR